MSADNYLMIKKSLYVKQYMLQDCCASSGAVTVIGVYKTEGQAVKAARKYMKEEIVEYGLNFNY